MGHKRYGEEKERPSIGLFLEWLFALLMWFPICIGGWLVHFGMDVGLMLGLTVIIAVGGACYLTFSGE